ncbi:Aminopeptidase P family protein OS=Streptomyces microflavus OX=1919 GN=HUT09_35580 PE=4 SV=1 [Streptomyces microflavus]
MTSESPAQVHTGSHDLPVPVALDAFMAADWAPSPLPAGAQVPGRALLPDRLERLSARFPGERLVIPAGTLKVRSNDTDHRFRPHSAYAWLTGLTGEEQPDHVLVLEPSGPEGHEAVLHVRPRSPRNTSDFYRDRRYGEFWVGRRPDLDETAALTGLRCAHLDDLAKLLTGPQPPTRLLAGVDARVDGLLAARSHTPAGDAELDAALAELRLRKDSWEVGQLQLAVDHTTAGFEDVARALPDALRHPRGERWIEGVFQLRARSEGNGTGYETIAAAGAHACVLHWIRNDGPLDPSQLLLLDAGVETDTLYTADITRTLPLSGRSLTGPTGRLRTGAGRTGGRHRRRVRGPVPGLPPRGHARHRRGTARVGHPAGPARGGARRRQRPVPPLHPVQQRAHARHRRARLRAGPRGDHLDGVLEEGHVLTVEPGLYLQPDDETLPPELRGMGVRIEDDLVITADGAKLLSGALPRTVDGVEEWMARLLDS